MSSRRYWSILGSVLAFGLGLRLLIAFVPLGQFGINNFGFSWDMSTFADWMGTIRSAGLHAYEADPSINYPPVFADILAGLNFVGDLFSGGNPSKAIQISVILLKLPAILADLGIALTVAYAARRWYSQKAALWGAGLYLLIPVTWYDSAIWGQVDSIAALLMLLAIVLLVDRRPELSAVATVLAILTKPQGLLVGLVLAPVFIGQIWRRQLLWRRAGFTVISAIASFALLAAPWNLRSYQSGTLGQVPIIGDAFGLWQQAKSSAGLFQVLTANAYNPWQLAGYFPLVGQYQNGKAAWSPDDLTAFGIPASVYGTVAFAAVAVLVFAYLVRGSSPHRALLGYAVILVAFFDLPTRVHERYLVQAFAILAIVWAPKIWDRAALVLLSVANVINLHAILSGGLQVIFPPTSPPADGTVIYQHHGISPDVYGIANVPFDPGFTRDEGVIYAVIVIHTLALGYLIYQLVSSKRRELQA